MATTDDETRRAIALFRFGVLGPLVSARLEHGDRRAHFESVAARDWVTPDGRIVRISARTIEAWYYAYRKQGLAGLMCASRSDCGSSRAMSVEVADLVERAKREKPRRSLRRIIRMLERAGRFVEDNPDPREAPMSAATTSEPTNAAVFASAAEKAAEMSEYLTSKEALGRRHEDLEDYAEREGREWIRRMLQGHYDLRGAVERVVRARGGDGVLRTFLRPSSRPMLSIVGALEIPRIAYQAQGVEGLHPMDAALNLPCELYSHVVRRAVAERAACDSYEEVVAAIGERTGMTIGKRQVEQMAARAARDFDDFYAHREADQENTGDLLVLTFDGKGVPMRREDLRPETRAAAEATPRRLHTRLTKGEKRHRKRMAEVAAVYTVAPYVRTMADVLADLHPVRDVARDRQRPRPSNKRVWASLTKPVAAVIRDAFEQARRRDPHFKRTWVVLLDGNRDQLKLVKKTARKLSVEVTIVIDLIHVLEYLWKAAYAFHGEGSKDAEQWVQQRLMWLLQGEAAKVSDNLRRNARDAKLEGAALKPVTKCLPALSARRARLHRLRPRARRRHAHRHRHHRGGLSLPREGPHGANRRALVACRCGGRAAPACPARQRRLRRLLGLPPRTRTRAQPPPPLRRRPGPLATASAQAAPTTREMTGNDPFHGSRTQKRSDRWPHCQSWGGTRRINASAAGATRRASVVGPTSP
jgi:hypothetical protein